MTAKPTGTQAAEPLDLCELAPGYIRSIAPYQPGKPITELAREFGLDESKIVKLASNENPAGRPRRAVSEPVLDRRSTSAHHQKHSTRCCADRPSPQA